MLTVQAFRTAYPAFDDHTDSRVEYWLRFAQRNLDQGRWDDWWVDGCHLHAAHNLTLQRATEKHGAMNVAAGPVVSTSKSVGGVSRSESRAGTAATGDPAAGEYNLTWYGRKYWQMAQMVGAGGIQI